MRPPTIPADAGSYASLDYWMTGGDVISMQPWAKPCSSGYGTGAGVRRSVCLTAFRRDAGGKLQDCAELRFIPDSLRRIRPVPPDLYRRTRFQRIESGLVWLLDRKVGRRHDGCGFRGFNDQTWLDDAGHPHSDALHTIGDSAASISDTWKFA